MSRLSFVLAAALALGFGGAVHATTLAIAPNDGWHAFDVDDFTAASGGTEWIDLGDGSPLSFSVTTSVAATLTVVDGGFAGDTFHVTDNGALIGTTSSVPQGNVVDSVGTNFDAALASGNYSFATFLLSAGTHLISGSLAQSLLLNGEPLNATVGGLRVSAVPLPATLPLLLSGGWLVGLIRRRRAV